MRDRSDEMQIMTSSGVYITRNVRRRLDLERWDFKFLTTLKGAQWNPNLAHVEMAADARPADMAVPMLGTVVVPLIVVAASELDRAASRLGIKRSEATA